VSRSGEKSKFEEEFTGFTPLMLAIAGGDQNHECLKILMQWKADLTVQDQRDNNLIHIATKYGSNRILEYLISNTKVSVLERNKDGETPLTIAKFYKNQKAIDLLEKY